MKLLRRQLLQVLATQSGVGRVSSAGRLSRASRAVGAMGTAGTANNDRILVVLELSGGNDGLNTVVPYGDDAYYRYRPKIGIRSDKLRKLDHRFGLNPGMAGFERLWQNGQLSIVLWPCCAHPA